MACMWCHVIKSPSEKRTTTCVSLHVVVKRIASVRPLFLNIVSVTAAVAMVISVCYVCESTSVMVISGAHAQLSSVLPAGLQPQLCKCATLAPPDLL